MELVQDIEEIVAQKEIGTLTFLRISFYDYRFKEVEQTKIIHEILRMVFRLKNEEPSSYSVLKNEDSLLVTLNLQDECLVNLAFASWDEPQVPVFKIELVGKNGMIQYDSQADNAFSGTYTSSPIKINGKKVSAELEQYIIDLVEEIQQVQQREVKVG